MDSSTRRRFLLAALANAIGIGLLVLSLNLEGDLLLYFAVVWIVVVGTGSFVAAARHGRNGHS